MQTKADDYQRLAINVIRKDGGTQPRAIVHDEWITEYADDMRAGATFPPVVVFFDGSDYWLADGFHRLGAAEASRKAEIDATVRQGTRRDAVLFSVGANAQHGHRRTNEDKRRAVDALINDPEWSKWSDREIARQCCVDKNVVTRRRHSLSGAEHQINAPRLVTRGGTTYTMQTDAIGRRIDVEAGTQPEAALATGKEPVAHGEIDGDDGAAPADSDETQPAPEAKEHDIEFDSPKDRDDGAATISRPHLTLCTGNNEWYTPGIYIAAARVVLGDINLDPASSAAANQTVQAERFYSAEDNGLAQSWFGNLWLNPPYSQPLITQFMAKLVSETAAGNVKQAICLVNNASDTGWFQNTFAAADAICFPRRRITFTKPDGTPGASPLQGQTFFYFGPNVEAFTVVFGEFGAVLEPNKQAAEPVSIADAIEVLPPSNDDGGFGLDKAEIRKLASRFRAEEATARKAEREQQIAKAAEGVPSATERYDLVHGPLTDLLNHPAESVDFIITDPPYPAEFLPVFGQLGEVARHLLKPGGLLLCMSGQTYLREVCAQLDQHLTYHWPIAYLTPGGQATQVWQRKVNTFWKPVLVYSKGAYAGNAWFGDVARSNVNDNDKQHHHWGQSESGMMDLMRRFVRPGHVVVDPFLGGGTTAVVALDLGATFIGCDVDTGAIDATKARLANAELAA